MRMLEKIMSVGLLTSADINAGVDSDSINMKDFHSVAFDVLFGPSHSGASGAIIKLYAGATNGAKTTALTFNYTYPGGDLKAASADIYAAWATSAALQLATATMANRNLRIELEASEMPTNFKWLTLEVGAEADAGEMTIMAHLVPRYGQALGTPCLS